MRGVVQKPRSVLRNAPNTKTFHFAFIAESSLGQYKHDKWNGKGTYYYANGDKYTGYWVDDVKTGHGVFTWSDGSQYRRNYSDKMKHTLMVAFRIF